jgi:tRNA dimethylallyltransferase
MRGQGQTRQRALLPIVILLGPTASGKTPVALDWAERLGGEIVSADSMQVYRHMDVGTAKPSREARQRVRHHLLDVVDPDETFNAAMFQRLADLAIADIHGRGRRALIVGGTGLYIRALHRGLFEGPDGDATMREFLCQEAERRGVEALHGDLQRLDPEAAGRIHSRDLVRIVRALEVYHRTGVPLSVHQERHGFAEERYRAIYLGIHLERSVLYAGIDARVERMMADGLLEEVERLMALGYGLDLPSMRAIGYRHMGRHIKGESSLDDAVAQMKRDTRRYAKRQMTWFRRLPEVHWFEPGEARAALEKVKRFLDKSDNLL